MQSAKPTGAANPPFATKDGKPANQGTGGSGAHDFIRNPSSPATGGGRDFTRESRPQSEARPEVAPNPQEIPTGGKDMKADPGPVSATVSGTAEGPQPRSPMKLHNPPFSVSAHNPAKPGTTTGPGVSGSGSADSSTSGSGSGSSSSCV